MPEVRNGMDILKQGVFFSPNTKTGDKKRSDAIKELFPEINKGT